MNPRVFVSHASEDKERFVVPFATKLRENGVEAWLDKWEMLPGDSLVDKIFEEGLKGASAVIIVLSKFSVVKPWVREEINNAFVKRIQGKVKLIPVVIDDCVIPEALSSTLYQRISDVESFEDDLQRILLSIYGKYDKPPVGSAPTFVKTLSDSLPDLTPVDTFIFKIACELGLEHDPRNLVTAPIVGIAEKNGIVEAQVLESLEVLDGRGFIKARHTLGAPYAYLNITLFGFDLYLRAYYKGYDELFRNICVRLAQSGGGDNWDIAESLNANLYVINHVFEVLESRGLVRLHKSIGGGVHIFSVSVELKRLLA